MKPWCIHNRTTGSLHVRHVAERLMVREAPSAGVLRGAKLGNILLNNSLMFSGPQSETSSSLLHVDS